MSSSCLRLSWLVLPGEVDEMAAYAGRNHAICWLATALSSSKHFIPGAARDLAWHPDCSCFRYADTTTPL